MHDNKNHKMKINKPTPAHGALGERQTQKNENLAVSAISGTVVIPSRKVKVHVQVPTVTQIKKDITRKK